MILYGIPNCDTCRKARKELEAAGRQVRFRDIRKEPLSAAEWGELVAALGDPLINRRSTTWRGLTDRERAGNAADLLSANPALMKRPVCRDGGLFTLGWDASARARWIG